MKSAKMQFYTPLFTDKTLKEYSGKVALAAEELHSSGGQYAGNVGWLNISRKKYEKQVGQILAAAGEIIKKCDVLVVLGVGGSYLGAKSAIDALKSQMYNIKSKGTPNIYFLGNSFNGQAVKEVLELCRGKDVCVNMISKSGSTLETYTAFEIFEKYLHERYGEKEAAERMYCTTGKDSNFYNYAYNKGYKMFEVPPDIGGRYSVLTQVGLLPMAVAGIDIEKVLEGAEHAAKLFLQPDIMLNDCYKYAAYRHICFNAGKPVELFVFYNPNLLAFGDWLAQLFGESEGKCGRGIFPTKLLFSTDLHSLGQFIQQGNPMLFETTVFAEKPAEPKQNNMPELLLSGNLNRLALDGAVKAHTSAGVPGALLEMDVLNEYNYGFMVYFFQKAAAISAMLFEVNPFDQPGVEDYKKNIKDGIKNLTGQL